MSGPRPAGQTLAQPRWGFFPAAAVNGVLLPGDESEVYLTESGAALWHRRVDWEHGPQTWQPSTLPAEVVCESVYAIRTLIDADNQLRALLDAVLINMAQGSKSPLPHAVPAASPYEASKTSSGNTVQIVVPGGYVGDLAVTFTRTTAMAQGKETNASTVSWLSPRSSAAASTGDLPHDVVSDVVDVLVRLADLVTWTRTQLNALPHP